MKRLILITACFTATAGAFAQPGCVKTAVNLTGNQTTLTTSGASSSTTNESFVYYEKKRPKKQKGDCSIPGVAYQYPSDPLLLNDTRDVKAVPENYTVRISTPEQNMTACADSTMNVNTMLNVERVGSYTGNYPKMEKRATYSKISKRDYKVSMRKKRKIEKKEEKIARRADVTVEVKSDPEAKMAKM